MLSLSRIQDNFSNHLPKELPVAPFRRGECGVCFDICFNVDAPRATATVPIPFGRCLYPVSFGQLEKAGKAGCQICDFLATSLKSFSPELNEEERSRAILRWETSVDDHFRRRTFLFRDRFVDFFTLPGKSLF